MCGCVSMEKKRDYYDINSLVVAKSQEIKRTEYA